MTPALPSPPVPRLLAVLLTSAAVLWMAAIFLAPAGVRDGGPRLLAAGVYGAAALVCHQRPERSFHLDSVKLPVCARCTGLYVSGALGALIAWLGRATVPRHARMNLVAAAIPTALTVAAEWLQIASPDNVARAAAALPLGALAAWMFVRLLRAESRGAHAL